MALWYWNSRSWHIVRGWREQTAVLLCAMLMQSPAEAGPLYPPFGLDLSAQNPAVKPGDDFFEFANGQYLARTSIPPDRDSATRRDEMTDHILAQLRELLEKPPLDPTFRSGRTGGKIGTFYAAFMDEEQAERLGAAPLKPELDAIRSARDSEQLARLMGSSPSTLFPSLFAVGIDVDPKAPERYAAYLGQTELGLPDRDYYLRSELAAQRDGYRRYAARLLELAGWPDPSGSAQALVAFETELAAASWTKAQQRDAEASYHPIAPADLPAAAPGFAWPAFLQRAGIGDRGYVVLAENDALPRLAAIFARTPVETLQAWMAFRVADAAAPYLSRDFVKAHFDFRLHQLNGQAEPQPRWKRAVRAVAGGDCGADPASCYGTLAWAVGELYARRFFPLSTRVKVAQLVANVKIAMRSRIQQLDWMSAPTKAEALRKLDSYTIKIGAPDKRQRDYSKVVITRDDLLGNVRRVVADEWRILLKRSNGPVDHRAWLMTPQTNNAYSGSLNDIVFPAGILQPPIFDPDADPAINYGAIGGGIGHELSHGFDDEGRHTDANGRMRDWWTPSDSQAFEKRANDLGRQYSQFEPVPGFRINPELTMGENIADVAGLAIALDAYHASLGGKPAPIIGGLTGDQRVFLGWAQAWAGKMTPDAIRRMTLANPHSYRKFRVNGPVRNIDAWYEAFNVKPGDRLYLPPSQRIRIW